MIVNKSKTSKVKLSILLLSLGLALTACETEEEAAEKHLEKGIELLKKGDYAAAQLELRSAKQGKMSTAETYYYLALADEQTKHYLAMQDNLKKTLELDAGHHQARVKLGKLELLLGNTEKAQEHLSILLKKNAQDNEALLLQASILLRQQKQDEALFIIGRVLEADPVNVDGVSLQAMALAQQEKLDEALLISNRIIELDEKNAAIHFFRVKIHGKQNDVDAVINDYLALIAVFPKNDEYRLTLAKLYTQSKQQAEAEALLREYIALRPNQAKPKIIFLEFLGATAADQVGQQLEDFVLQLAKQPKQLFELSQWMLIKGKTLKAEEALKQVVADQGFSDSGIEAKILLAKLAFDKRDYPTTKKIAADILNEKPDQLEAKLLQVRLLLIEEEYQQAKKYLDKIIWTHPKSDAALVLLAQVYLVEGDWKKAQGKFKEASVLNPANLQAFNAVYTRLIRKGDTKYARKFLLKALRRSPRQTHLLKKLIELNIQEEKWQEATQAAMQLARVPKQKSLSNFYLASIYQGEGQCEKAIAIYKELFSEFPEQLRILQNMSACYKTLNKQAEMIGFLNEYSKENRDNIAATIVLSDLYVADKKYKSAIKLLNGLVEKKPRLVLSRQKLVVIYTLLGKPDKAIAVCQQALQVIPGNIRISLVLASLYEQQGVYAKAVKIYELLHEKNPSLKVVNNNLAVLLVEHFATADNLDRAYRLVSPFAVAQEAYFKDTYAWVLFHMGRREEAAGILNKLIITSSDIPVFRYHMAVIEFENGNNSRALTEVSQAIELAKQGKKFPERKVAENLQKKIVAKMRGH